MVGCVAAYDGCMEAALGTTFHPALAYHTACSSSATMLTPMLPTTWQHAGICVRGPGGRQRWIWQKQMVVFIGAAGTGTEGSERGVPT